MYVCLWERGAGEGNGQRKICDHLIRNEIISRVICSWGDFGIPQK